MDDTNKDILRLLKKDGRMSYTEIGDRLGISRVAVKKRVAKLEQEGIIRGYKAVVYREDRVKMLLEITTLDDNYEDLLEYLSTAGYVTELYILADGNRIHATTVAPDVSELKYLAKMVRKKYDHIIRSISCHEVKEIVKDTYGGVDYDRTKREHNKRDE